MKRTVERATDSSPSGRRGRPAKQFAEFVAGVDAELSVGPPQMVVDRAHRHAERGGDVAARQALSSQHGHLRLAVRQVS